MKYRSKHLQNVIIQTNKLRLGKDEIEILERLRQPKTLHVVCLGRIDISDIIDRRMREFRSRVFFNIFEHAPCGILERLVAGDPVHDEDGLDGLGPKDMTFS